MKLSYLHGWANLSVIICNCACNLYVTTVKDGTSYDSFEWCKRDTCGVLMMKCQQQLLVTSNNARI